MMTSCTNCPGSFCAECRCYEPDGAGAIVWPVVCGAVYGLAWLAWAGFLSYGRGAG